MTFLKRLFDQHQIINRMLVLILFFVSILLGFSCSRPSGQFTEAPGSPFPVGSSPNSVAMGDFNGDGKADLAIPNAGNNNVTVLLGNGTGGFTKAPGSPFPVGRMPSSIAMGDFNGDGKPDLVIGNEVSDNITVLLGNGRGGFTEAPGSPFKIRAPKWYWDWRGPRRLSGPSYLVGPSWPVFLAVGDFNGDGKPDLVIANIQSDSITVLLGNGMGGFTEAPGSTLRVASLPRWVAVSDFNGDGKLDLAISTAGNNNVTVLLGNGTGGFTEAPGSPFPVGKYPRSVAVGDFNGDGKPDLAIANAKSDNITVLLGNGTGGFTEAPGSPFSLGTWLNPLTHGTWPFCVAVGDFNGDGRPDLAIANTNNIVTVLLGNGMGGFTEAPGSPFRVGSLPKWIAVGDFNGDGKPDLAIVNRDGDKVTVLLNSYSGNRKGMGVQ